MASTASFITLGIVGDRRQVAPLLAEFADQHAFGRKDPQRQLGPVVRQVRDVGQVGIGHRQRDAADDDQRQPAPASAMPTLHSDDAQQHAQPGRARRRGGRGRSDGLGEVSGMRVWESRRHYKNARPRPDSSWRRYVARGTALVTGKLQYGRFRRRFLTTVGRRANGKNPLRDKDVTASIEVKS